MKTQTWALKVLAAGLFGAGGFANAEIEKPDIQINGFFDGYYSFNFNNPKPVSGLSAANVSGAQLPPATNTYRYYDTYHNQMTLNLAELSVKASFKEVALLMDLDFGPFADLNATASSAAGPVADESSKQIGQAVVSYRPRGSRFSFDAGKMYSHLGVETVKSKDNFNYSHSILFSYGIPFWHTGIRLGYDAVPGALQTSFYVYNGWNTQYDVNRSKSLGLQLRYAPSQNTVVAYNFLGGPERTDSEADWKSVHELNLASTLSDSVSVIADLISGSEANAPVGTGRLYAEWYGGLAGLRWQANDRDFWSPRIEIYRDDDGSTLGGAPQTVTSATLTYGHRVTAGLETRIEVRSDFSDAESFLTDDGTSTSQTTLLLAGLFQF